MQKNFFLGTLLLVFSLFNCSSDSASEQSQSTANPESNSAVTDLVKVDGAETNEQEALADNYNYQDGYALLDWNMLAKVNFEGRFNEEMQQEVSYPIFSEEIKGLNRKPVVISGYLIPIEETQDETIIILSAFPYSNCFFCGNAGPETVMDILPKGKLAKVQMDQQVTFRGKLRLNDTDFYYLNYILDEAELVD